MKNLMRPPGPSGSFLLGSTRQLRREPLKFLTELAAEYGDVAHFRIGRRSVYQLNHPDLIRDVLVTKNKSFHKTGIVLQARPILGRGLLTSEGDEHTRQRRMIQPTLGPQRVLDFAPIVIANAKEMIDKSWEHGKRIDLFQEMLELTLKIITESLFAIRIDEQAREVEHAITIAIEYFSKLLAPRRDLLGWLPLRKNLEYRRAERYLNKFVYGLIEERRRTGCSGRDLLSRLVEARDVEGDRTGMTDRQLRDELLTALTAGHETIATALTWTFYLLDQNPHVKSRLHDELDYVLGDRPPDAQDLPKLSYTRMIFAESLRLYPPLWALSRQAIEDVKIGDFHVPAGSIVGMSQYVMHRDGRYFSQPERFDPIRWLDDPVHSRPKYSYFPFGGGPRLCIGEPLAWLEGVLLIAAIAQNWQIRILDPESVTPQPMITLRPRGGMPSILHARMHKDEANDVPIGARPT